MGNYAYPPSGAASVRPHAVISTTSGYSYTYDANGNMLTRIELSGTQRYTYTQQWDVDNRLIAVTNTVTLSVTRFYYDGDGQRVKKVESKGGTTITTAYVGAHFEKNVTAGVTTTYYYASSTRVAMRQGSSVYYLNGDHLGSASLTTDYQGNKLGDLRYMPYGETRYVWGSTPTDRRFTGQREEAALGSLYDYGARFYSPYLNRFISPDTIVPSPGNPQALNRYTYVLNSPVNYTDPTGHCVPGEDCPGDLNKDNVLPPLVPPQPPPPIWLYPYTENGLRNYHQYQGNSTNDCAPTSMAMAINLRMGLHWQPVRKDALGKAMQDASRGLGTSGYRLTDWFSLLGGKGATPPQGQERALNEFARELGSKSFRAVYKNNATTKDLIDNLKNGDPTIITVVWPGNTTAHAMVVAGYDSVANDWALLNPADRNPQFTRWSTVQLLANWDRPFALGYFQNATVTLYR